MLYLQYFMQDLILWWISQTVTTISGFLESYAELNKIASQLKTHFGTGGSIKEGVIVIQGDHWKTITAEMTKQGFQVKLAGG